MADGGDALIVEVGLTEREYLRSLARIEAAGVRSAKASERQFARANKRVNKSFQEVDRSAGAAANGGLRMASMQLSQVAQQGAVTGNYLQALAIQAPDLALGFGAVGIAAGALIPILYGVASAALGAEEEIEKIDVQGAYSSATSAIDAAREAQDRYTAAVRLTGAAQSEVTPEILNNLRLEAQAREAMAALEIAQLERQRRALEANLEANRQALQERLALANQGLQSDPNAPFANTEVERARLQNTRDILAANQDLVATISEQQTELDAVNAQIALGHGETSKMVDELINASNAAGDTAMAIGGIDFSGAISGAQALAERLDISLHKAMQIMGLVGRAAQAARDKEAGPVLDPRAPGYDPIAARMQQIRDEGYGTYTPPEPEPPTRPKARPKRSSGRSGGGGGRGADRPSINELAEREIQQLERQMEALGKTARQVAELEARYRLLDEAKERGLALDKEIAGTGETLAEQIDRQAAAIGSLADKYEAAKERADFYADTQADLKDGLLDAAVGAESLSGVMEDLARSMAKALLQASLFNEGPFARGGGGGGLLGGLMGAIFPGGGGGVSRGAGGAIAGALNGAITGRAAGGRVKAGVAYDVGEHGRERFVPETNGRIMSASQTQQAMKVGQSDGGVHVTFAPVIDARNADAAAIARLQGQLDRMKGEVPGVVLKTLRDSGNRGATRKVVKR